MMALRTGIGKPRRSRQKSRSYETMMKTLLLQNQQIIIQQQNMMFMVMKQMHSTTGTVGHNMMHQHQQQQQQHQHQQHQHQHPHHRPEPQQQPQSHQHSPAAMSLDGQQQQQQQQQQPTHQHSPASMSLDGQQQQQPSHQHSPAMSLDQQHPQIISQDPQQQQPSHQHTHPMPPIEQVQQQQQQQQHQQHNHHHQQQQHQQQQQQQQQHPQHLFGHHQPDPDALSALLEGDGLIANNLLYNPQTDIGPITPYKSHEQQQQRQPQSQSQQQQPQQHQTPSYYSSGGESLTTPKVDQQLQPAATANISQNVVKNLNNSFKSPTKSNIKFQILSGPASRDMKNSKAKIIQSMNISEFLRQVHHDEAQRGTT